MYIVGVLRAGEVCMYRFFSGEGFMYSVGVLSAVEVCI